MTTNGKARVDISRDRRTLGRTNTLLERDVDLERLHGDRLHKVQAEMRVENSGRTWS